MPILFRDYETHSTVDLQTAGTWKYAAHADSDVWCCAYAVDDGPINTWVPNNPVPEEFHTAARDPDWLIAAHGGFEYVIEQLVLAPRYGWPLTPIERLRCTMAMALACALPGSLEGAAKALGLPGKDAAGARQMRQMSRPRKPRPGEDPAGIYWHDDPEKLEQLYAYCRRDVEVGRELFRRLPPLLGSEQALWALDSVINQRGFFTDGPLLEAAHNIVTAAEVALQTEFRELTGLDSTNQTEKLIAWLAAHDCSVTDVQKGTLHHALRRKSLEPAARRAIELRLQLAHASAGKIEALLAWRGSDGRVRGTLKYHGAATGRWAGHGPQPQNFKRDGEGVDAKIAAIMAGGAGLASPVEAVGAIARGMICATPGHRLLIGDFSGVESRCLAWISGQQSKLEQWAKFDRTGDANDDPYVVIGRSFGHPDDKARGFGKIGDLAFGYQGGVGAWQSFAPEDDASDEATIKSYRDKWRAKHPRTEAFWYAVDRAAINAVQLPGTEYQVRQLKFRFEHPFLRIVLPSGRALNYPFPRIELSRFSRPCVMFKDNAGGKWVDCNFGRGAYGGLWTENITSAIARDLLAAALMRLEGGKYRVILHVHDEICVEVADSFGTLDEFQRLITTLPDWAEGLPIAAKVRESQRFSKPEKPTENNHARQDLGNPRREIDSCVPHGDRPHHQVHLEDSARLAVASEVSGPPENGIDHPRIQRTNLKEQATANASSGYTYRSHGDNGPKQGRSIATWIYAHPNQPNYLRVDKHVLASGERRFYQHHWNGSRWVYGVKNTYAETKIPYRLLELIAAPPAEPVWVCEGEKDADNVAALGLIATCNPGGAKVFQPELAQWFKDKQLTYVVQDNDSAGAEHTRKILTVLRGVVPTIAVITFPELVDKGDVSDWLEQGGNKQLLLARAEQARQRAETRHAYVITNLNTVQARALQWIWPGHLVRGGLELMAGTPEIGKSQIHCQYIACTTTGREWPNGAPGIVPCRVVVLTAEDSTADTLVPRLKAAGAELKLIEELKAIRRNDRDEMFLLGEDLAVLEQMIVDFGDIGLVTIDPITAYMGHNKHFDSHRATDVRSQLSPLKKLAEHTGIAISAVTHPPKNASPRALDHFIGSQAFIAAARIGHLCVAEMEQSDTGSKRPTGRRFFTNPKINIEARQPTLIYTIDVVDIGFDEAAGTVIRAPVIRWHGESELTADEALEAARPTRTKGSDPKEFLVDILISGPVLQKVIIERGAERGFSYDQLWRAKRALDVKAFKRSGENLTSPWLWALPQHIPPDAEEGEGNFNG
jgi:DNA polymerase